MFNEDERVLRLADELLEFFDLEELLSMNDLEPRDIVARGISLGLIMCYDDMEVGNGTSRR